MITSFAIGMLKVFELPSTLDQVHATLPKLILSSHLLIDSMKYVGNVVGHGEKEAVR